MRTGTRRRDSQRRANCLQVARLLQSYLDGAVDDETTTLRIAAHLEDCRRCGLKAETYQAIKDALAHRETTPPDAVTRLRAFGESLLTAEPPTS
ncbi:MAG: zf-HC2 domain-containing protein [Sciscionella sp.]